MLCGKTQPTTWPSSINGLNTGTTPRFAASTRLGDRVFTTAATKHLILRNRFIDLEIAINEGGEEDDTWKKHRSACLQIERDEPPIYRVLDLLCDAETRRAEGIKEPLDDFQRIKWYHILTRHFCRLENIAATKTQ